MRPPASPPRSRAESFLLPLGGMSPPLEGRRIPDASLDVLQDGKLERVDTAELFRGRTVVLFTLPGAFTPTCSNRHVPRYQELAADLTEAGVDGIVCMAVNDPWVMDAWGQQQHAPDIRFVPDSAGKMAAALGLLVDKPGLGMRSRRASMLVRDGVIEKAFVEPEADGDPYGISDADTMLRHLNPQAGALQPVTVFAKEGCPFCERALALLREHGVAFETLPVGQLVSMQSVLAVSGASTVPQIFIGGRCIGGADALARYFEQHDARSGERSPQSR